MPRGCVSYRRVYLGNDVRCVFHKWRSVSEIQRVAGTWPLLLYGIDSKCIIFPICVTKYVDIGEKTK